MVNGGPDLLALAPASDSVRWEDGRWFASGPTTWLAAPGLVAFAGRWLRLTYHAGLFDEHVRPLVRFTTAAGDEEVMPMAGALAGVGIWTGRVPRDTVAIAFSPVRRLGAFSFAITSARPSARLALLAHGLRRCWPLALTAIGARLIGSRREARHCLAFAALPVPLASFARWYDARDRAVDLSGFDRAHGDWSAGPTIHLLFDARDRDAAAALAATIAGLRAQSYPRWLLHVVEAPRELVGDPRVRARTAEVAIAGLGKPQDLVAVLRPGDQLLPHGLAHVAEAALRWPDATAFYGDEIAATGGGGDAVRLKPDFSPIFAAASGYVGAGAFVRLQQASGARVATLGDVLAAEPSIMGLGPAEVVHIRRLVVRRTFRPSAVVRPVDRLPGDRPPAAIVIPTRDRPALLRACLDGLRTRTDYPLAEIVIVDNGTTDPEARAMLAAATADARVRVVPAAGPFNYSALCNAGAAASDAPLLVFLNNDVTPIGADWLGHLAAHAVRQEVGAVGPKLLFPDGRVQHGGVVLGLGGTALNAYRLADDGKGYLGQLGHAREVMAVTGAVQVVERAKFSAVGGFDAEAFPILLNDVDICLRLAQRGWRTLYEPAAVLCHDESSSRGRSVRPFTLYAGERRAFQRRWGEAIRDDPYHHPALSLYAETPALG